MSVIIEKLKISNFLSFFGEYEVNLTTYTALICNFYEGKDDFFRAFEFVFGANLSDLRVEKPLDLVHKVLREEFLINREVRSYVEITLGLLSEKKQLKLLRSIKNGANNPRIEHKISDLVTSSFMYEEKLNCLGVHINQKNLIFYKSYFNNAIWGSPEDLEWTICTCLRENYLFEEWKKANEKVEYLTTLKNHTAMKDYNSMKKYHSVVAKCTEKFEVFSSHVETALGQIHETLTSDSSESGSTSSLIASVDENQIAKDMEMERPNELALESKMNFLVKKLNEYNLQEALLTSHLYHEEIRLAAKPVNSSVLQNRIRLLKMEIQEKEKQMSEIWGKIQGVQSELENLGRNISLTLISLEEFEVRKFQQNRFTHYGRFYDYLQPSRYVQLLKQIIGNDIFYAHLCDSVEDAFNLVKQLRDVKYGHREVFLPLENYSHKLKDVITASGEKGVGINTLEELLIFLCKLKHYELIDHVPVVVQRRFNFEEAVPNDYTVYIQNNIYFENDGLISVKVEDNDFFLESENEMVKRLITLCAEEEIKFRKWKDLLFLKWKTLDGMNSLENDIFYLKQKWRKSIQSPHIVRESSSSMEIYEEYQDIFKAHAEERERYESELPQEEESLLSDRDSSVTSNEESLSLIIKDLEEVKTERKTTQDELEGLLHELHLLSPTPVSEYKMRRNFIKFHNNLDKKKLFFEKELRKLRKLIGKDDLEDFLGSLEWQQDFIASLILDLEEIKTKLKLSMAELQDIATQRKTKLYKLFEHCNRYLTSTFSHMLDGALPFVNLSFEPKEEKIHIMSCLGEEKINAVDIKHFNTFLSFMSAFSIFLEIAKFDKIPFMVIDDIEEYFPIQNDNLSAVLDSHTLDKILPENENSRFHLLMRVGQFLQHYIKKNTPGKMIRNNGSNTGLHYKLSLNFLAHDLTKLKGIVVLDYINGPMQILYFTKEDFVHTAEHYLWIKNQILPDEYISENCNSHSGIYEINLNN